MIRLSASHCARGYRQVFKITYEFGWIRFEEPQLASLESRSKSAWQTVRGQGVQIWGTIQQLTDTGIRQVLDTPPNLDLFFPRVGENYDHQSL
jgi:hypothetical protein